MGRRVMLAPNPLDIECANDQSFTVPELPWDVHVSLDEGALGALADASRAIGLLEGARRAAVPVWAGEHALAVVEAWSCVRVAGMAARWVDVEREFADDGLRWARPTSGAGIAARLIGFHLGLSGFSPHWSLTGVIKNELHTGEFVSPRFRHDLETGLPDWLANGKGSGLVKAALATMSIAAAMPESRDVAMCARALFPHLLFHARGSTMRVPISQGFLDFKDDWNTVATALAHDDGYDEETVNRALEVFMRAVERAAVAAAHQVESVTYNDRRIATEHADWFATASAPIIRVFYTVSALPCGTRKQLEELTGHSTRSVNRAVRELSERGIVRVQGQVRGERDYAVFARPRQVPWPEAASRYPSVSAADEGQR